MRSRRPAKSTGRARPSKFCCLRCPTCRHARPPRPVKNSSATQNQDAVRPLWSGLHRDAPRIVAHRRRRIQKLSVVLRFLLTRCSCQENQHHAEECRAFHFPAHVQDHDPVPVARVSYHSSEPSVPTKDRDLRGPARGSSKITREPGFLDQAQTAARRLPFLARVLPRKNPGNRSSGPSL